MRDYQAPADLLKNRVILVTGAGQGLGRAAALAFAKHGATVVLHGRKVNKLEAVYDEIEKASYPRPVIFPLDLETAKSKDFEALAQATNRSSAGWMGFCTMRRIWMVSRRLPSKRWNSG